MFEIIAVICGFIGVGWASFLLGKSKERVKVEKEFNDALEHEAQSWADIAHTDDDFINGMSKRIDGKR